MSTTSSSQSTKTTANILGGDYAGLSATFSSKTGQLVPVPEHLVPESMLEWGDIPSYFEVLNSEDWTTSNNEDEEELQRTTITVMPEVGCGIDNLEVTKKTEHYAKDVTSFESWAQAEYPEREVTAINRNGQSVDMETIFKVDSESNDEEDEKSKSTRRIRVSLSLDMPTQPEAEPVLSKLITIHVEKKSSTESTKGTAWSGPSSNSGGLDARTVMNTIGKGIVYGDVFAVKKIKGGGDQWDLIPSDTEEKDVASSVLNVLEGSWTKCDDAVEVHRTIGDFGGSASKENEASDVTLRLPQNILVRYGKGISGNNDMWAIEVSHIGTVARDNKTYLQHRIVSRALGSDLMPSCSLEEKVL